VLIPEYPQPTTAEDDQVLYTSEGNRSGAEGGSPIPTHAGTFSPSLTPVLVTRGSRTPNPLRILP
jgi:hypothetical protein